MPCFVSIFWIINWRTSVNIGNVGRISITFIDVCAIKLGFDLLVKAWREAGSCCGSLRVHSHQAQTCSKRFHSSSSREAKMLPLSTVSIDFKRTSGAFINCQSGIKANCPHSSYDAKIRCGRLAVGCQAGAVLHVNTRNHLNRFIKCW